MCKYLYQRVKFELTDHAARGLPMKQFRPYVGSNASLVRVVPELWCTVLVWQQFQVSKAGVGGRLRPEASASRKMLD